MEDSENFVIGLYMVSNLISRQTGDWVGFFIYKKSIIKSTDYEQENELGRIRSDKGNQRVRDETSGKCQTEGTVETRTGGTGEETEGHVLGG